MSETTIDGPSIVAGTMFGGAQGTSQEYNPLAGPSVTYQGDTVPDVRWVLQKNNIQLGSVPGHLNAPYFLMADAVPVTSTNTLLSAAQNVTASTPLTLISTSGTGADVGTPIVPFQGSSVVSVIALDFGFTTGSCTAGSGTITSVATGTNYFFVGQQLVIAGQGNAAGTKGLITSVVSFTPATNAAGTNGTITVSPVPLRTGTNTARIGNALMQGVPPGGGTSLSAWPYIAAGAAAVLNPQETIARCVSITTAAGASGTNVLTVRGYDIYGVPMSEAITAAANTTTYGKKAFKYIVSVTPSATDANNYSVGTGDTFGFIARSDRWEYTNLFWNAGFLSASTGWTAADLTSPATATTGDVRGTLQLGTRGAGTGATTSPNGSIRLAMFMTIPPYNLIGATSINSVPMYGVPQFTN